MALIDNPTTALLERALAFRELRHQLITSNIANASTPGYRAFDAVLRDAIEDAPLAPRQTQPGHQSASADLDRVGAELERSDAPARLDGNNVSLDSELLRLLENRTTYQAAFELLDRLKGQERLAREVR
jgi:flagellar basal-body rod protein FlgB